MSLANNVITHQIDPVYFDQNRCEFKISPKVWLSNWRLSDLAVSIANGKNDGTVDDTRYVSSLGAYSLISRIVLYNNSTQIAELREAGRMLGFMNLQRTNANSFNVARTLNRSSFAVDVVEGAAVDVAKTGGINYELLQLKGYASKDTNLRPNTAGAPNQTPTAYLDLSLALPFLKAQPYVLGTELKHLRLVIEWAPHVGEAQLANFIVGKAGASAKTLEIVQPTLILDEVADPAAASKLKNKPITYVNMDHEVVNVPGSSANLRLRAFDDKFVRRLLFMNQDTSIDSNVKDAGANKRYPSEYFGAFASYAQPGEKINMKLNGVKYLPYDGITTENQKLAYLNDSWGNHLTPQGAQYADLIARHLVFKQHETSDAAVTLKDRLEQCNLCSQMSIGGVVLNQKVEELMLEYSRDTSGLSDEYYVQAGGVTGAAATAITFDSAHNIISGSTITGVDFTGDFTGLNTDVTATVVDDVSITVNVDTSTKDGSAQTGKFYATTAANNRKVRRGGEPFNLLLWGEVVQTMSVQNNKVSIVRV